MLRLLLSEVADRARLVAFGLVALAAAADVLVWAYDSGRAAALLELVTPPTQEAL
jgi:hypothetical protein